MRDLLSGAITGLSNISVGTSNAAPAKTDVALGAQVYADVITQFDASITAQLTCKLYTPTGNCNGNTLREAGLWAGSYLYARATFADIIKTFSVAVTITWVLT